jgi:HSP20 family protein
MTAENKTRQTTQVWLGAIVVLLVCVILLQGWVIYRGRGISDGQFAPRVLREISRLWRRPAVAPAASKAADSGAVMLWEPADELHMIHEQIQKTFNDFREHRTRRGAMPALLLPARRAPPGRAPATALYEMEQLQDRINRIFENALNETELFNLPQRVAQDWEQVEIVSPLNLTDDGSHYTVTITMPGLDAANIQVSLEDQLLTISAGSAREQAPAGGTARQVYRQRRQFTTRAMVPGPVDGDAAQASYADDVLRVVLPKLPGQEPLVKRIKIR